jgi:hypothetical protein
MDPDPDPGGPKTCGSGGSGSESATLVFGTDLFLYVLPFFLESGEVVRINTGAPIPPGADAVVMVEDTKLLSVNRYR